MKKIWYISLILLLALLAAAGPSMAAEQSTPVGKDLTLAIGMKLWYNTWQSSRPANVNQPGYNGFNVISYTSDSNVAYIPSISLKFKDFFISASYLNAPEYKFQPYSDVNIGSAPTFTAYTVNHTTTAKRTDFDTNIGFYLTPNFAFTMGYKVVSQEITDTTSGVGVTSTTSVLKPTYKGLTYGIVASVPIGEGFGLFGNLAMGKMDMEYKGGSSNLYNTDYYSTELGIAYRVQSMPLSFTLGYRLQSIEQKLPDYKTGGSKTTPIAADVTKGTTFGMNFVF